MNKRGVSCPSGFRPRKALTMKDLRKEIKERLDEIEPQRVSLQKRLDSLAMKEKSLKVLLESEVERWTEQLSLEFASGTGDKGRHSPLYSFILTTLAEGAKRKDEILSAALKAKVPITSKRTKVAVHFTLLGMANAQVVERIGDLWKLKKPLDN